MSNQSLSLFHLVRKPIDIAANPPLLVLLHGVGSNEEELFSLAAELDRRFLIVSARAPIPVAPDAYGWFSIEINHGRMLHNEEEAVQSLAIIDTFINNLINEYNIDASRVYLMGFSQGAIMSIGTALLHPEKIAGAVVMSGCLLPCISDKENIITRINQANKRIQVIMCHGVLDNILTIELGRGLRGYLETLPIDLEYHEYPMAHQVSYESFEDIKKWLSKQLT